MLARRLDTDHKRLWFLFDDDGDCQPLDFLFGLDGKTKGKMLSLLDHVDEYGYHPSESRFEWLNPKKDRICEIKQHSPTAVRLLAFETERGFIIARGHKKKDNKLTRREMEKVRQLREAFLGGGGLYE